MYQDMFQQPHYQFQQYTYNKLEYLVTCRKIKINQRLLTIQKYTKEQHKAIKMITIQIISKINGHYSSSSCVINYHSISQSVTRGAQMNMQEIYDFYGNVENFEFGDDSLRAINRGRQLLVDMENEDMTREKMHEYKIYKAEEEQLQITGRLRQQWRIQQREKEANQDAKLEQKMKQLEQELKIKIQNIIQKPNIGIKEEKKEEKKEGNKNKEEIEKQKILQRFNKQCKQLLIQDNQYTQQANPVTIEQCLVRKLKDVLNVNLLQKNYSNMKMAEKFEQFFQTNINLLIKDKTIKQLVEILENNLNALKQKIPQINIQFKFITQINDADDLIREFQGTLQQYLSRLEQSINQITKSWNFASCTLNKEKYKHLCYRSFVEIMTEQIRNNIKMRKETQIKNKKQINNLIKN